MTIHINRRRGIAVLLTLAVPLSLSACASSGGSVTCTFHRQLSMRAMGS